MMPFRLPRCTLGAVALTLLAQAGNLAHAAPRTVYTGTLQGAGDVVMELDSRPAENGVLTGRYFYPKHGVDIPLKGTAQALVEPKTFQALVDAGKDPETDELATIAAATWHGKRNADGYQGQWTDARTGTVSYTHLTLPTKA